jgi:hypothetical protein
VWFPSARQPNERRTTPTVRLTAAHSAPTQLEAIGAPSAFARPSASLTLPTCALYRSAVGGAKAEVCNAASTDATCVACLASVLPFMVTTCSNPTAGQACPAGVQDTIDKFYVDCDGLSFDEGRTWDSEKPNVKASAEACGCGGVAQAAPALFVALAAVANHFLA